MYTKRILQQINDLKDPVLFSALHWRGHALRNHILTDEEMREAIRNKKSSRSSCGDIVMISRFFNEAEASELIIRVLENSLNALESWLLSDCDDYGVFEMSFDFPTGDGLVFNTNWKNFFTLHGVCVVLSKKRTMPGQSFIVKTAYPICSFEDVDPIYDAIDDFVSKRSRS